jgi:hypothetical protein
MKNQITGSHRAGDVLDAPSPSSQSRPAIRTMNTAVAMEGGLGADYF